MQISISTATGVTHWKASR